MLRKILALLHRVLTNVTSSVMILGVVLLLALNPATNAGVQALFGVIKDSFGLTIGADTISIVYYGVLSLLIILFIITMETATKNSVKNPEENNEKYKKGGIIFNAILYFIYLAIVLVPYLIFKEQVQTVFAGSESILKSLDTYVIIIGVIFGVIIILDVLLCVLNKAKKEKSNNKRR
jgi:hypothetical protein